MKKPGELTLSTKLSFAVGQMNALFISTIPYHRLYSWWRHLQLLHAKNLQAIDQVKQNQRTNYFANLFVLLTVTVRTKSIFFHLHCLLTNINVKKKRTGFILSFKSFSLNIETWKETCHFYNKIKRYPCYTQICFSYFVVIWFFVLNGPMNIPKITRFNKKESKNNQRQFIDTLKSYSKFHG